jgi:DNA-binding transcriptional LysR family regulator
VELRELRAFVAAGQELHFARAAARLQIGPSTMSELIRRLELELGSQLFTRTTRRITLTDAGAELLGRAETILDLVAQATAAVGAVAGGEVGVIRLGITPPAGPVIAPHLARGLSGSSPDLSVEIQRMWLPALGAALRAEAVDAALTCGGLGIADPAIATVEIGAEPLLVGLRPGDALAAEASIELQRLEDRTLGMHPAHLFPAWHAVQRQILADAELAPPVTELDDPDLTARRWTHQPEIEWIMLVGSLLAGHDETLARPARGHAVPFTLSWRAHPGPRPAVRRFVDSCRLAALPDGWLAPAPDDRTG